MRFHEWREKMRLTQRKAAFVHGVSIHTIRKWEQQSRRGEKVRVRNRKKFGMILGMSQSFLWNQIMQFKRGGR